MDQNIPRVSVIIPTFNRASELSRSISSVLCQTYVDFELIVVDDASTDQTENVINAFKDERIRYKRLLSNVGGAEARNVGIRLAKGEYVAFQDSDDEWSCSKLALSISELETSTGVGGVFSAFIQIWDSGCRKMPIWSGLSSECSFYESLLWRNVVDTPTLVVRKSILEEVGGFDPTMPRYQDWELALRLAKTTELSYLSDPLVNSRVTEGSISHNQAAHSVALQKIYKKHRGFIDKNKRLKAAWFHRIGDARMLVGDRSGRRLLLLAWITQPFSVRVLVKLFLSLVPGQRTYSRAKKTFSR